jgi:endonuclease/exonuclease/phosphatase family metal-dependent hydrolase
MMFKRRAAHAAILVALFILAPVLRAEAAGNGSDQGNGGGQKINVMTMNMYPGTDLTGLLSAGSDLLALKTAVTNAYENILNTNPAGRIAAMAREIIQRDPDLVGLQEADLLRTGPSTSPATPATNVKVDFLKMLLADLANLGQSYHRVAIVPGVDVQAPSTLGKDIRLTDRTVIIARSGDHHLTLSNRQVEDFQVALRVPVPALNETVTVTRGWASIDAALDGRKFRFVTTHLEVVLPVVGNAIQLAQATELLGVATGTRLPVIMAADFNANADNPADPSYPTYTALLKGGFADAWTQTHPNQPGYTCCQAPDLQNRRSELSERIDLVLYRGSLKAGAASLAGELPRDRARLGLWPSDHAAVEEPFGVTGSMQVAQH